MNASHVLRTDGGGALGFGHVNRCLVLADAIRDRGGSPEIVLGASDAGVRSHIAKSGHSYRQLDPAQMFDREQTLQEAARAIFDFSHTQTRANIEDASSLLLSLNEYGVRTLLIDAKGDECLSSLSTMTVDVLAIPYAGAETQTVLPGTITDVRGPQYFVLNRAFLSRPFEARPAPEVARQILVTAGGSDPTQLTLFFLDVLEKISTSIDVHVVIGPGFSEELTAAIEARAERMPHETLLIYAPDSLADEMFRADLALSASGLTKYELAYSGTPCILLSIDDNHAEANDPFAALGTCHDAGKADDTTVEAVVVEFEKLLGDIECRCNLAAAGRAAVDGQGTQRLLDLLDGNQA